MKTLRRSVKRGLSAGEPLPFPYPIFEQKSICFRRSCIQLIAGPPGSMKTQLALNIVDKMGTGVPTLYHSSDSDDFTVASRVMAMKTGMQTSDAELMIMATPHLTQETLKEFDHVKWSFHAAPTLDHMWKEAEAFREEQGTYPHHTVVDIMMDVDFEGVSEQNYWALMAEFKVLARDQATSLTIVHHTSESAKGGTPPPRSAIMGKANQTPVTILTLWGDSEQGTVDVAVVKNRFGPQDAMAKKFFRMEARPSMCQIEEVTNTEDVVYRDGVGTPENLRVPLYEFEETTSGGVHSDEAAGQDEV